MNTRNFTTKLAVAISMLCAFQMSGSWAGSDQEEIRNEISFLAKKLLKASGEETITIKQAAKMKPFIGICGEVTPSGVLLTCITPGHGAEAAGLKTGDLIETINDVNMIGAKKHDHKAPYYKVVMSMDTGDELVMKLKRGGENKVITVTVGAIDHPAYTLTVSRK